MPNMDLEELFEGRRAFTEKQWIDALLRSTGMEPTNFQERVKWHLPARMIPLVENNYNLAELGPRGTGKSQFFTNQYGLIVDYLAEWFREMRKRNFGDAINKYFKLGRDLNQRDTIAVKHTVSGLLKLLYPTEEYDKDAVRRCLEYALEARRRVKEQLKKIGGMEFFDVHFSYIDIETMEEKFISVPEQGGGSLIPDGPLNPGVMHTVATGSGGHLGLYRLETQVTAGNGTLKTSGLGSNSAAKEALKRIDWLPEPESLLEMSAPDIGLILLQFCAAIPEPDRRRRFLVGDYIGGP